MNKVRIKRKRTEERKEGRSSLREADENGDDEDEKLRERTKGKGNRRKWKRRRVKKYIYGGKKIKIEA